AAAQGLTAPVDGWQVDGEGPAAVSAVGELGAVGAELAACGVAAGAAAVDASSVRVPAHDRDLCRNQVLTAPSELGQWATGQPVRCENTYARTEDPRAPGLNRGR